MKRFLLKIILSFVTFFIFSSVLLLLTGGGQYKLGVVPLLIIYGGMFAAIRAIWKYNPDKSENTDISLKKDDE